jgi:HEAT repeat protein
MRFATVIPLLIAVLVGCGTPEVARDYEARTFLPAELEEALRSDDPARRADAAGQLESMGPGRRLELLIALTGDERAHVRLMAVSLLGGLHADDADAVDALDNVLALDPDVDVRSAAVGALGGSRNPVAIAVLVRVLADDASLVVKREAAEALDRRTGEAFGKSLVQSIETAEEASDDAVMAYEEWLERRREALRWNEEKGRFEEADG